MVGAAEGFLVVLDHQQGVPLVAQGGQGVEQTLVVARVEADGGFVEDVENAAQVGSELGGEPDALGFASGKGVGRAIQLQVAESHFLHET